MWRKLLFIFGLPAASAATGGRAAAADAPGRSLVDVKPLPGGVSAIVDLDVNDLDPATAARFDTDRSGRIDAPEVEAGEAVLASLVAHGLVCSLGEGRCTPEVRGSRFNGDAGMLRVHLWYTCPAAGPLRVSMPLLERLATRQEAFLTVRLPAGVGGRVLTAEAPSWEEEAPGAWERLKAWWSRWRGA
jgi:hypothetical protein